MNDNITNDPVAPTETTKNCGTQKLMWWMTLLVAVLAVPSFGVAIAAIVSLHGLGAIVVFILACWLCTYLGMRLMSNPKMHEKKKII